ncbi:hypothetical protein WG66_009758 [Moniliophthora roreri]|nr:hypothetical protein WG66_009758 [Moniliophthora roreri]
MSSADRDLEISHVTPPTSPLPILQPIAFSPPIPTPIYLSLYLSIPPFLRFSSIPPFSSVLMSFLKLERVLATLWLMLMQADRDRMRP